MRSIIFGEEGSCKRGFLFWFKLSRPGLSRFRRRRCRLVPTCLMKTFRLSEIPSSPSPTNKNRTKKEEKKRSCLPVHGTAVWGRRRRLSRFSHSSVDPINIVSRGMSSTSTSSSCTGCDGKSIPAMFFGVQLVCGNNDILFLIKR